MKKLTQSELIQSIRRLQTELGHPPTAREMADKGSYSLDPFYRVFGSWNAALQEAVGETNKAHGITEDELLAELETLHDELGYPPRRQDMAEFGKYSPTAYYSTFESWNAALEAAGYSVHHHSDITQSELVADLQELADELGATPTRLHVSAWGAYSPTAYYNTFDDWNAALEAADLEPRYSRPGNRRSYDYGAGWNEKKRRAVRQRDDYRCQHCGMPQETHIDRFGERLTVHHIIPARSFDNGALRNDPRNLVALCRLHHRTWEAATGYAPQGQDLPPETAPREIDRERGDR